MEGVVFNEQQVGFPNQQELPSTEDSIFQTFLQQNTPLTLNSEQPHHLILPDPIPSSLLPISPSSPVGLTLPHQCFFLGSS
jgi:hypothetical protein